MNGIDISGLGMIIFDIDGTLAETDDYYTEKAASAVQRIFPFLSGDGTIKLVRPFVMGGETVLHTFYRILDLFGLDGVISRIHSRVSVSKDYKYRPVGKMKETLELLGGHFKLGIISSGGRQSTISFIKKYGLEKLVPYVISGEDSRFIKPHRMPIIQIAGNAGVDPKNCLMVGDTVFDIICAKRAGAYSAAVLTGFDYPLFIKLHHPDLLLDSVDELPGILLKDGKKPIL